MKAGYLAHEALAVLVVAGVFEPGVARHPAAHAGDGEAAFPALLHVIGERGDDGVDEDGVGDFLDIGVARIRVHAEEDDAKEHADLRRGEAGAVEMRHGVAHVLQQFGEFGSFKGFDRLRNLPEARIAHAEDVSNHFCPQNFSRMRRTRPMATSRTSPILSSGTARALSPRPAAQLATTAIVAQSRLTSRASAASGMPVMPTMCAPSRSRRVISAAVSRRGPCVAA